MASANEILVLTFANKAKEETVQRMKDKLGGVKGVSVSTFHALGSKIIAEVSGEKKSLHGTAESDSKFNQYIDSRLSLYINTDKKYAAAIARYFSYYLYPMKEMESFHSLGEYYQYVKEVKLVTIKGEEVKSLEELQLANYFALNQIRYEYERPYSQKTATVLHRQYKPDFYLPDYEIYIEHFAINGQGRCPSNWSPEAQEKYLEGMTWKRQLHNTNSTVLVETTSAQFSNGSVFQDLSKELKKRSVKHTPVDVLALIKDMKFKPVSMISNLISKFINLQKNKDLLIEEIVFLGQQLHSSGEMGRYNFQRFTEFIKIYKPIYQDYQSELQGRNEIDFNDMINDALRSVKAGKFKSPWKYILVDEFQDI